MVVPDGALNRSSNNIDHREYIEETGLASRVRFIHPSVESGICHANSRTEMVKDINAMEIAERYRGEGSPPVGEFDILLGELTYDKLFSFLSQSVYGT